MRLTNLNSDHNGFSRTFAPDQLSLGMMMPTAPLENGVPDMDGQLNQAARIDELGFAALWSRDVPLFDPDFGDAGQIYDPWIWLSQLAARTRRIALSTAGIVLPLRHPIHVAKAAASLDVLSSGRFMLGAASGDRATEYPAFGFDHASRGEAYRDAINTIRKLTEHKFPRFTSGATTFDGSLDLLPKPTTPHLPIFAVGSGQQSVQWIAEHADGWISYPRDIQDQRRRIGLWHTALNQRTPGVFKPFAQSLFVDLTDDPDTPPSPIFLGFRFGRNRLIEHLNGLKDLGVHHVMFNLRHSTRPAGDVIEELGAEVLPHFPPHSGIALNAKMLPENAQLSPLDAAARLTAADRDLP